MAVRAAAYALLCCLLAARAAHAQLAADVTWMPANFSFDMPPAEPGEAERLLEYVLHVSTDRGASWRPQPQSIRPGADTVEFSAPQDGEYWFAVQKIYKGGRRLPARMEGTAPSQKVMVDTVAPRLEAAPVENAGRTGVLWSIFGEDVDYATFAVESRVGNGPWTKQPANAAARGQAQWNAAAGPQEVRVSVRDFATNLAVKTVMLGGGAAPLALPGDEAPVPPAAGGRGPLDFNEPNPPPGGEPAPRPRGGGRLVPEGEGPLVASTAPAARPGATAMPGNVPTSYVNKLLFNVNYKVEATGKSGVKSVSLYWRHPEARDWDEYGVNPDPAKPFKVTVDGEGRYGIALRALSGVGLGDPLPAPGAAPQLWVVVDTTPPAIRLEPPKAYFGAQTEIVFRWRVSDPHPGVKPVRLSYAAVDAAGNVGRWQEIARGLDNDGTYRWRLPESAPFRLHAKIEAEDAAGNQASEQTSEPVAADNSRPHAVAVAAAPRDDNGNGAKPRTETEPVRAPPADAPRLAPGISATADPSPPAPRPLPEPKRPNSDALGALEPLPAAPKPSDLDFPPPPPPK